MGIPCSTRCAEFGKSQSTTSRLSKTTVALHSNCDIWAPGLRPAALVELGLGLLLRRKLRHRKRTRPGRAIFSRCDRVRHLQTLARCLIWIFKRQLCPHNGPCAQIIARYSRPPFSSSEKIASSIDLPRRSVWVGLSNSPCYQKFTLGVPLRDSISRASSGVAIS